MTTAPIADLRAFQNEVREFLRRELTQRMRECAEFEYAVPREIGAQWHRKLFEAGWIAPSWPLEYGGTGWSAAKMHLFAEELALAGAPMIMPFGIGMVGPVIYTYGSKAQKALHLPGILDGSVYWCQGYSEPGSGSDLASLQTRAVRDGDEYVVNGQKTWTTNAHTADWMFVLARTDPAAKPQRGISFLLVDMASPGIEIRPIVSIDGFHHVNEVYFTDVRVPAENRVGEENQGWTYAKFLLGHERTGAAGTGEARRSLQTLRAIASREAAGAGSRLLEDDTYRAKLDTAGVQLEALAQTEARVMNAITSGGSAGQAASMLKQLGSQLRQQLDVLRIEAVAHYSLPFDTDLQRRSGTQSLAGPAYARTATSRYNFGRAVTIAAGSSEVQRDVIAKSVLGL